MLREQRELHVAELVADIATLFAVFGELAVADLIHRRIIADHRDIGRAEAVGGLHVEGGHAEGAVAVVAEHLFVRVRQFCRERKAGADAERAERAGVHPVAGRPRAHRLRRDRHHVAAIADIDRVVGEKFVDLIGDAVGIDRRRVGGEHRHQLGERRVLGRGELGHPLPPLLPLVVLEPARGRRERGGEHRTGIADNAERNVAVLADGAVVEVDLHQSRHVDALAVAHAEIERRADNDDDVGLGKGERAGTVEMVRIAGRQQPAAAAVEIAGNVEAAQKRNRLLVAARRPHLLAEQDRRPLGIDQNVGEPLDVFRVADRLGRGAIMAGPRQHRTGDVDLAVEDVTRDFEITRAVGAGEALACRHRDHVGDALGRHHRRGEFGDRLHHLDMRQVL